MQRKSTEEENNKLIECLKACLPDEKLEHKVERLKATETSAVILLSEYARRIQDMNKVLGESFATRRSGNAGTQQRKRDYQEDPILD